MKDLFDVLDRLLALPAFSREAIAKALEVQFTPRADANPYWHYYRASPAGRFLAEAEFSEPGPGASDTNCQVTLTVAPGIHVTEDEVWKRYGMGKIGNILPNKAPEGTVTEEYRKGDLLMFFEYTAVTHRLLSITLRRPCQRSQ